METKQGSTITQDVYLPVDVKSDLSLQQWNEKEKEYDLKEWLELKTGMVVLTKEQFKELVFKISFETFDENVPFRIGVNQFVESLSKKIASILK